MTENKKHPFNRKNIAMIVTGVLIVCIAVGVFYVFNREDPNKITAVGNTASPVVPAVETASASLPAECTDVNSFQYIVNKKVGVISQDYVPADLVDPENVESTSGVITVRQETATKLEEMVKAAKDGGVTLLVSTAYRSYADQELVYSSFSSLGEASASMVCEKAGYSEHQLGLGVDFTDNAETPNQTVSFAETDAGKWLYEHAHEYGFILRYPEGKESITGYNYMPWHYRYVGTDVANAIYSTAPDCTMEEYFGLN